MWITNEFEEDTMKSRVGYPVKGQIILIFGCFIFWGSNKKQVFDLGAQNVFFQNISPCFVIIE